MNRLNQVRPEVSFWSGQVHFELVPELVISHILPGMSSWTGDSRTVGAKQVAGRESERSADTSCIWLFVDGAERGKCAGWIVEAGLAAEASSTG